MLLQRLMFCYKRTKGIIYFKCGSLSHINWRYFGLFLYVHCSSIGLMNPHRVRHWKFMMRSYCGLQVRLLDLYNS